MGCDLSWYGRQPNKQLQAQCAVDLSRLAGELGWDYDFLDGSTYQLADFDDSLLESGCVHAARYGVVVFPWAREGDLAREVSFSFADGSELSELHRNQLCTRDLARTHGGAADRFFPHGYWRGNTRETAALSYLLVYVKRLFVPNLYVYDDYDIHEDTVRWAGKCDLFSESETYWRSEVRNNLVACLRSWLPWGKQALEFALVERLREPYSRFTAEKGKTTRLVGEADVELLKGQLTTRYGDAWMGLSENLLFFFPSILRDMLRSQGLVTLGQVIAEGFAVMPDESTKRELLTAFGFLVWPENTLDRDAVAGFMVRKEDRPENTSESVSQDGKPEIVLAPSESRAEVLDWLRTQLEPERIGTLEQLYEKAAAKLMDSRLPASLHFDGVVIQTSDKDCVVITIPELLQALRLFEGRFEKPFDHLAFTMKEFFTVYAKETYSGHRGWGECFTHFEDEQCKKKLAPMPVELRREILAGLWEMFFRLRPPRAIESEAHAHLLVREQELSWYSWKGFFVVPRRDYVYAFDWQLIRDFADFVGDVPRLTHSLAPLLTDLGEYLHARLTSQLRAIGITTLGDLVAYSLENLLAEHGQKWGAKQRAELSEAGEHFRRLGFDFGEDLETRLLGTTRHGGPWHRFLAYASASNALCKTCRANRTNACHVGENEDSTNQPYCQLRQHPILGEDNCFCPGWISKSDRAEIRAPFGPLCRRCAGGESSFEVLR